MTSYTMSARTWSIARFLRSEQRPAMYLIQVALQLCLAVALSRLIFLDWERRRGRDPPPLVRILQTWVHFWEKGAANLTNSGPCGDRCVGIQMYSQRRRGIQYPRVEDTSPSIRWDWVLAEAGNSVVKRSPDCNHFLSRGRLRIARLQELR
jgi:hypothetical protein